MVGHGASEETVPGEKKIVSSLAELVNGTKVFIEKDGQIKRAELLSRRVRRDAVEFYVHIDGFNKRLDEWINADRIDLKQEVELPAPPKEEPKKEKAPNKALNKISGGEVNRSRKDTKRGRSAAVDREASGTPESSTLSKAGRNRAAGKENRDESARRPSDVATPQSDEDHPDVVDLEDAVAATVQAPEVHSREEEVEKLRTQGSMTQNPTEINRVRNLAKIQMGEHEIVPWYFSPYPQECTEADVVYICEFCLSHHASYKRFTRHRAKCTLQHPPGNEIYRDDTVSFFEVDGRRQLNYARNLCLISKLFLDHKTLYYDVDPFLFYIMCTVDERGYHIVGYFSKEKESVDGYNVACILTLPQYQRKGFGRLLIAFSYELSKKEGKNGHPEKPLSDLGLLGYRAYWTEVILQLLVEKLDKADDSSDKAAMSVESLANATAMTTEDVLHTLQSHNMLRFRGNAHVILMTDAAMAQWTRMKEKAAKNGGLKTIDPAKLVWRPYTLTASGRTWNW